MAEEVKVFGVWGSPFSRRVEIALKLKGVPYEYIEEDLSNKSPLLLKYNPVHKKIPVFVHNGKPIAESLVILQYIDETWDGYPLLPQDPYDKAISLFWAKFIDEKCLPAAWDACRGLGNKEKAIEEVSGHLETLENELKDKRFFGGDKIGFVDIVANFIALWLGVIQEAVGLELLTQEKFPNLSKWSDEFVNCNIVKENLPDREKLLGYFQARFANSLLKSSKKYQVIHDYTTGSVMAEEVKVFGVWGSPFSRRVEIALKLKGVPYEYIEEDLSNKSPLLLKYNPVHKKIPVFVHNGKPIAESLVILQYIDETWDGYPLLPQDPYDKAISLFWAKFIDEKCLPAAWDAYRGLGNKEKAIEELETLENELKDKRFFGGDKIGFVDIVANLIALWFGVIQEAVGLELLTQEKFPNLSKWSDEFVNCNIVKENLPPREKLLGHFQAHFASSAASK
ncbi:GST_C domain-containing protein/GST_N_3 domain-containing protein [Cephalotus follicularis]|uniref:glutathione transferase n=1 Tax=Cephalotus follicularis TaxID=3775 RepID=A0A1Q3BBS1_CEPFO|nr:GST_C domain-containing protein/GST_N_3 domain-containing protein [Cephalotus follicularis]